ncbi:MAG: hypothetical protein Q9186_005055 [Xanthomendoza sp. 1 TL-2023]
MAPSCNHEKLQCAHKATWPKWTQPETWTSYRLALTCCEYEESQRQTQEMIHQHQSMPALSDNETEVDPQEAEDEMNNLPSPIHTHSRFWTPEYQAQRDARKRLWSPPLTPPSSAAAPSQQQIQPGSQIQAELNTSSPNHPLDKDFKAVVVTYLDRLYSSSLYSDTNSPTSTAHSLTQK